MCSQEVSLSNQSYAETGLRNRSISATHKGGGAWLEEFPARRSKNAASNVSKLWLLTIGIPTWAYRTSRASTARKTARMKVTCDGAVRFIRYSMARVGGLAFGPAALSGRPQGARASHHNTTKMARSAHQRARLKGNFSSIASLRGGRSIFPHLAGKVI